VVLFNAALSLHRDEIEIHALRDRNCVHIQMGVRRQFIPNPFERLSFVFFDVLLICVQCFALVF